MSTAEPNILLATATQSSVATPHQIDCDGSSGSSSSGVISGSSACVQPISNDELVAAAAAAAVSQMLPTNPQYGVAIIPTATANLMAAASDENVPNEVTDSIKPVTEDGKELHSTPSRNDRFKVVKIASLEPFKRGRWKCMDYVDEAPPQNAQTKVAQSTGSIQVAGGVYLQTQSLPPQQIQQMLMQGGVMGNGAPFFSQVPAQVLQQGQQYFYPPQNNMQNQGVSQPVPTSMPAQFINAGQQQQYFPPGTVLQNAPSGFSIPAQGYQNIQYVPANLIPNQNSAFVPTSQTVQLPGNFQQSQSYAGQPQSNVQQPLVNGHAFEPNQITPSSLPNQTAKSVILNTQQQQQQHQQPQTQNMQAQSATIITQNQSMNYQQPNPSQGQSQPQPPQQQQSNFPQTNSAPAIVQVAQIPTQNFDQNTANIYANPQFPGNTNSLPGLENSEAVENPVADSSSNTEQSSEIADDKTNPVVNAIDNKIEQAMDLVKSHLMYTVREEVEVLKEKIIELTEKIQQLETENSFLRSQLPKNQTIATSAAPTANTNSATQSQSNTSPNVLANNASTAPAESQNLQQQQQQQPQPSQPSHQQQQQSIPSQQQNVTVTQQQQQQPASSQQPPPQQ